VTEIGFYHLTRTGLLKALPQLLARTLAARQRALVLCRSPERVGELDRALWEAAEPWLPHGTPADGDADLQPIWISTEPEAANQAKFLFLVDGNTDASLGDFERVFDLFDGNDQQAVAAARDRWRLAKSAGHTLTYWQQGARGWEKKG
jgi:DNA polymerase-3 subunit chi